jgi:hypothetical protein
MPRALLCLLASLAAVVLLTAAAGCLDLTPIPFDAGPGGSGGAGGGGGADAGADAPATD